MNIIDQTPYFNKETGEISLIDRGKAIMNFGADWIKEVEAQKQVMAILAKVLDRNYTLLRNVIPAGVGANFPFILVGPTGVIVMVATPLTGMFRAKGDQWGTVIGNNFKVEKNNLLKRTERMARAIQVYLQRQGASSITTVEAVLLCVDPACYVDSIRPIIRVVMRDALERFAISLTQARQVLNSSSVQQMIDWILNTPKPVATQPAQADTPLNVPGAFIPAFVDEPQIPESVPPELPPTAPVGEAAPLPVAAPLLSVAPESAPPVIAQRTSNGKRWVLVIGMVVIWLLLIAVFLFLVLKDQWSVIMSLFH